MPNASSGSPRPIDAVHALARNLLACLRQQDPACTTRHRRAHARRKRADAPPDATLDAALTTIVRECGLRTVDQAERLFDARLQPGDDYGAFWYDVATDRVLSHWTPTYDEARRIHTEEGGVLTPYKRHFAVVPRGYTEIIGLDPDAEAWTGIDGDLARPADETAY